MPGWSILTVNYILYTFPLKGLLPNKVVFPIRSDIKISAIYVYVLPLTNILDLLIIPKLS